MGFAKEKIVFFFKTRNAYLLIVLTNKRKHKKNGICERKNSFFLKPGMLTY